MDSTFVYMGSVLWDHSVSPSLNWLALLLAVKVGNWTPDWKTRIVNSCIRTKEYSGLQKRLLNTVTPHLITYLLNSDLRPVLQCGGISFHSLHESQESPLFCFPPPCSSQTIQEQHWSFALFFSKLAALLLLLFWLVPYIMTNILSNLILWLSEEWLY